MRQFNKFKAMNVFQGGQLINQTVDINCPFLVKTIKFDFAYQIASSYITNIIITSDVVNGELVGNLNNFKIIDNNLHHYLDGFSVDKQLEYRFQDAKPIGQITLYFKDLLANINNISQANIVIRVECNDS